MSTARGSPVPAGGSGKPLQIGPSGVRSNVT